MDQEIARLKELTEKSRAMVFFGGAGVSKESGIPDFRSVDGLYHQAYRYPPETILSRSFYEKNPEEFYRFYRSLQAYRESFKDKKDVLVVDPSSEFFRYMKSPKGAK